MNAAHSSLKAAKEAFVAGHAGTSISEINAVVDLVPLAAILLQLSALPSLTPCLFTSFISLMGFKAPRATVKEDGNRDGSSAQDASGIAAAVGQFAAFVLPEILVMMGVGDPYVWIWTALLLVVGCCGRLLLRWQHRPSKVQEHHTIEAAELLGARRARFVSSYRGAMMLSTCVAILGVDFHSFPRRFAKAETFGTGLMDVGVGSFVVASGLVSGSSISSSGRATTRSWTALLHSLALIFLGIARLLTTRGVDYQHPVGEYGVHWNFFLTLACVKLVSTAVHIPASFAAPAGLAILAAHQAALSWGGLIDLVHSDSRGPGFLSANKEGLLSLPGYWALHLLSSAGGKALQASRLHAARQVLESAAVGSSSSSSSSHRSKEAAAEFDGRAPSLGTSSLRARQQALGPVAGGGGGSGTRSGAGTAAAEAHGSSPSPRPLVRWLGGLAAATAALWVAMWAVTSFVQLVSRRACNAPYVLWMLAFNMQVLLLFAAGDVLAPSSKLRIFERLNRHMLPVFLMANLLTGAVNLSIDTLAVGLWGSRFIVTAYTLLLCCIAICLPG